MTLRVHPRVVEGLEQHRSRNATLDGSSACTSVCLFAGLRTALFFIAMLCAGVPDGKAAQTADADRPPASDTCSVRRATGLPGSHAFASEFIEAIANDPAVDASHSELFWGLTADISTEVPRQTRAMYISRTVDGGRTWAQVARLDPKYFNARIGEGLRNGFLVAPGAAYFIVTTQLGAFQVIPQAALNAPKVIHVPGPSVPFSTPRVRIPKKPGDPVRANVIGLTPDEKHLIIGYGYFDLNPLLFSYLQTSDGEWTIEKQLAPLPTDLDLLSMQIDDADQTHPGLLYLGTGDQVYVLNLQSRTWKRVEGVGPDSAIHGMSLVGGLHLAACWGVYNPAAGGGVVRVTNAKFLLHRFSDESGSTLRAYSIEVDPSRHDREVVTSISGVYTSTDRGRSWQRFNDLPEGEFRSAHFNPDGTVLVSGVAGTFVIDPFSYGCTPHLTNRAR